MDEQIQEYQYVRGSRGGRGYFRRAPYTISQPTQKQSMQRLALSIASHRLSGCAGAVQLPDGRVIPANAALLSPLLQGEAKLPAPAPVREPAAIPENVEAGKEQEPKFNLLRALLSLG